MVIRQKKHHRKYLGNRRWGAGNIKNRRGAGDRGGVGKGGTKHKFTYKVKYEKETIGKVGFSRWGKERLKEISLDGLSRRAEAENGSAIEIPGYKVLSNGELNRAITIKATAFSKKAIEKIKAKGGEAVQI